jgi:hypothetical protein
MRGRIVSFCVATLLLIGPSAAQTLSSERIANIRKAAIEIAPVHQMKGSDGAFVVIMDCYKRELATATSVTLQLERCMAQDIIISDLTVVFFSQISPEARKMAGAEDPETVKKAFLQRLVGVVGRFKMPQEDARAFLRTVRAEGMTAYGNARFPGQLPEKKVI